jgi:NADPH:quinone reductase-like Zn-dependent oxidoreductase
LPVLGKNIRLQGLYVGSTAMFDSMNAAIESLKIHPVIEKVYEFNEAPAALKDLETAQHVGKLVVRVN